MGSHVYLSLRTILKSLVLGAESFSKSLAENLASASEFGLCWKTRSLMSARNSSTNIYLVAHSFS